MRVRVKLGSSILDGYSHWIPSMGRHAADGSVALLAASVVVSGLIEAADPKPRDLLSRSPD